MQIGIRDDHCSCDEHAMLEYLQGQYEGDELSEALRDAFGPHGTPQCASNVGPTGEVVDEMGAVVVPGLTTAVRGIVIPKKKPGRSHGQQLSGGLSDEDAVEAPEIKNEKRYFVDNLFDSLPGMHCAGHFHKAMRQMNMLLLTMHSLLPLDPERNPVGRDLVNRFHEKRRSSNINKSNPKLNPDFKIIKPSDDDDSVSTRMPINMIEIIPEHYAELFKDIV